MGKWRVCTGSESSVLRPVTAIEIHQSYFDTRYHSLLLTLLAIRALTTVLAYSLTTALLAKRALTTVLAD